MNATSIDTTAELSSSRPEERLGDLRDQIIPANSAQVFDHRKHSRDFLESKDASLYLRLSNVPAPLEKPMDIQSLVSRLSSLLPGDRQLDRRARKLAWQLLKGRHVSCDWDTVFLSELTPAENRMSDDDFLALYADHVKTPTKKGGRPKKYRTAIARRKGHAERQRRYRERKLLGISSVTKTPLQVAEE
jgi:hypothetical protein